MSPALKKRIGNNIKLLRISTEMHRSTLAKQIGIVPISLYNVEKGHTTLGIVNLIKLSGIFGISIDDLIKKDLKVQRVVVE